MILTIFLDLTLKKLLSHSCFVLVMRFELYCLENFKDIKNKIKINTYVLFVGY